MAKSTSQVRKQKRKRKVETEKPMLFSSGNYLIILVGVVMVLTGFLAMYIENQEKGIIALYLSPVIIVAGFVVVAAGILRDDKNETDSDVTASASIGE